MLKFEVASRTDSIYPVEEALLAEADQRGFHPSSIFALRLALDEACVNAIKHGNGGDPSKKLFVEADFDDESVAITVRDQGPGFDPEKLRNPLDLDNLDRPNGRGVFLIERFSSEMYFNEQGNAITFRISSAPQATGVFKRDDPE